MNIHPSLFTFFLYCLPIFCTAQTVSNPHFIITIPSNHLEEDVSYWMQTIADPTLPSDSMNLLILLDGDEYFGLARDVINLFHADEKILPTMVVALPSTMESRWKYYTPTKAEAFEDSDEETQELFKSSGEFTAYAKFIKEELLPKLEKEAKTSFTSKTIFGHSMGGLGALNFLLSKDNLFDNYIIASPSILWDKYHTLNQLEKEGESPKVRYHFNKMYLTIAENDIAYYEDGVNYFSEYLTPLIDTKKSTIIKQKYLGETHMTVGLRSLYDGILQVLTR